MQSMLLYVMFDPPRPSGNERDRHGTLELGAGEGSERRGRCFWHQKRFYSNASLYESITPLHPSSPQSHSATFCDCISEPGLEARSSALPFPRTSRLELADPSLEQEIAYIALQDQPKLIFQF